MLSRWDLPLALLLCLAPSETAGVAFAQGVDRHLKVIAMQHPPFTLARLDGSWAGIEIRFLEILSKPLNFTFQVVTAGTLLAAPTGTWASSDAAVLVELAAGVADLAIGGIHLIPETVALGSEVRAVFSHSHDCGVFVTQATLALPRHRAIMGPFHWKVWLSLTIAYLFGAAPLAILSSTSRFFTAARVRSAQSVRETDPEHACLDRVTKCIRTILYAIMGFIHKMVFLILCLHESFWDVFGTFTNAFTLSKGWRSVGMRAPPEEEEEEEEGRSSKTEGMERRGSRWTRGTQDSPRRGSKTSWIGSLEDIVLSALVGTEGLRLLVAFYWAFTVIVSALYTGSIIAFITLPVFPKPYDTGKELLDAGFTWGTLATGDWAQWLRETDNPVGDQVRRLTAKADSYGCGCRGMRLFPSAEKGIRAVELSSSLAFLSSRSLLSYLIAHPASSHEDDEDDEEESIFGLSLLRKVVGKKRRGPVLAMATECFLPFRVGFLVKGSPEGIRIADALKQGLLQAEQAGLLEKARMDADQEVGEGEEQEVNLKGDVVSSSEKRWRNVHGNRLLMGSGFRLGHGVLTERILSLDDVQGIFLLLGAGFAIALFVLFMEIIVSKMKGKYCPGKMTKSDTEDGSDWDSEFSEDDMEEEEGILLQRLEGSGGVGEDLPETANYVRIKSQSRISAPDMVDLEDPLREPRTSRRTKSACTSKL